MSELLPTREAERIRRSLTDYLTTTFALADDDVRQGLSDFLLDADTGVFRGPYVRARVPFRAAADGWRDALGWYEGHTPYGHQAAAFERLSSANLGEQSDGTQKTRPLPTLVVTGTGSGKTEAFLYPILDHVLREQAAGRTGVKALILYPMNALANDQARRITDMIRGHDALKGVRAAIYTGETAGKKRTRVTADGLINDRFSIRENPPDILLTNYKMLDQLLLREADQGLIAAMAAGLQYLVLDEFHTYDGAQGTDVAMLLRRLGLALRRLRPESRPLSAETAALPLLDVTPVATSATLGDDGDPSAMLAFAETVFGAPFDASAVVTETRQSVRAWIASARAAGPAPTEAPAPVNNALAAAVAALPTDVDRGGSRRLAAAVLTTLYPPVEGTKGTDWAKATPDRLLAAVGHHDLTHHIAKAAERAVAIDDLADEILPSGLGLDETYESRREVRRTFITRVFAMLSHVRAVAGRGALSIDTSLWVRELSRVDRAATSTVAFSWSDDGPSDSLVDESEGASFPAIYCRHCGRSGWGIELAPVGDELASDDEAIRRNHASRETRSRFRALIGAVTEAETDERGTRVDGLTWFDPELRALTAKRPADDETYGRCLPVLTLSGDDVDDRSRDDECPACGRTDGIRFLGSAMATMLSVIVTTLFGDAQLDRAEKKALVFTDSVQDAAHRAGFIQSRAHVFALRNAIRQVVPPKGASLAEIAEALIISAGDDTDARYRLLAPDLVDRDEFSPFWSSETLASVPTEVRARVKERLLFDVEMEFGLQSRVGRTLELTGSLAASVSVARRTAIDAGRSVLAKSGADNLDGLSAADADDVVVARWVHGVLERMRERGAIDHPWFAKYIAEDGRRWRVWTGRPRGKGMPAFPPGREAPAFPRVGGPAATGDDGRRTHLDVVTSAQSWFAVWARRVLGVTAAEGATLTRALLTEMDKQGSIMSRPITGGSATAYALRPADVSVRPVTAAEREAGATRLACDVCHNPVTSTSTVIDALADGPCISARCPGFLRRDPDGADTTDYYRSLYDEGSMRRVVAREHTGLLEDRVRLEYENGFKASSDDPSAPNVLVATPTLEMGIDIGDLSTVMLAGIPKSVASYLQRVGRAGRLTGNALSLAAVTGRGDQLPRMGDPLSVINGSVRPPATFLDAQEIVQRQYFASILDRRSSLSETAVTGAAEVLSSSEPSSFLGDAVADAEANHVAHVEEFLAALPASTESAKDALRTFATPTDGPGTSGLAAAARDAVQRWNRQVSAVAHRMKEVGDAIPDLQKAADAGVEEDAKSALNAALAVHRQLKAQLGEMRNRDHWVSALERYGLLPNYTLLDDSVTLDAAVSWVDPDTEQWQDATYSYQRGAAVAIQELAPGAYFYAQGMEILIDAVDLGPGGDAVRDWAFCAQCGHARELGGDAGPDVCPRCGTKGMNDVAQRMRVVELETVSALARRDEAAISDRSDDRRRERFTVQVAADLDPAGVTRKWFDAETRFGVTYARDLTVRWINLGKQGLGGETRFIAGSERTAPLFRVCDTCGQIDSQAGGNSRRDHRSWCPRRLEAAEHTLALALSRTLVTQGAFLRLPLSVTLGDTLAVPSLAAALIRGFREVMGGDPDHLRVVATVEPLPNDGGTADALLVHDAVPGGTGYLAELAVPERMHDLLATAYRVVLDCECRTEQRAACHRCLLPYAAGQGASVSRASAEQALAKILRVDEDGEPKPFDVTEEDPGVVLDESVIEQLFRKRFIERATTLGGTVKEKPGDWGNRVQVSFPGDQRIWLLHPQVQLGPTQPDFVLEQHGGGVAPIAIYTDGKAFHASVKHNRLADDAEKRDAARALGYRVIAVTWDDLNDVPVDPAWLNDGAASGAAKPYGVPLTQLVKLRHDPLTVLMSWMQNPTAEAEERDRLARALPLMLASKIATRFDLGDDEPRLAAARALDSAQEAAVAAAKSWLGRSGPVSYVGRLGARGATEFALVLDDREDELRGDDFDGAWRLWLHLSNLIGWRHDLSGVEITTWSRVAAARTDGEAGPIDLHPSELPVEWQALAEIATASERSLIASLAAVGDLSVPEMGVELAGGVPVSFVWRSERLVAAWGLGEEDVAELMSEGWSMVEPEVSAIRAALAHEEEV